MPARATSARMRACWWSPVATITASSSLSASISSEYLYVEGRRPKSFSAWLAPFSRLTDQMSHTLRTSKFESNVSAVSLSMSRRPNARSLQPIWPIWIRSLAPRILA